MSTIAAGKKRGAALNGSVAEVLFLPVTGGFKNNVLITVFDL